MADLELWRASWETAVHEALEAAGRTGRVDHRLPKDRGLDRDPEPKIGEDAMARKREGKLDDPHNLQSACHTSLENEVLPHLRQIEMCGEVQHIGHGDAWWQRLRFAARRLSRQMGEFVRDESSGFKWQDYVRFRSPGLEPKKEVVEPPGRS